MPRPRVITELATAQRTVRMPETLLRQWDDYPPRRCKYRIRLVIADNKRLLAESAKGNV
jgi:hypothetical protein